MSIIFEYLNLEVDEVYPFIRTFNKNIKEISKTLLIMTQNIIVLSTRLIGYYQID
jgi:hypothetical protein